MQGLSERRDDRRMIRRRKPGQARAHARHFEAPESHADRRTPRVRAADGPVGRGAGRADNAGAAPAAGLGRRGQTRVWRAGQRWSFCACGHGRAGGGRRAVGAGPLVDPQGPQFSARGLRSRRWQCAMCAPSTLQASWAAAVWTNRWLLCPLLRLAMSPGPWPKTKSMRNPGPTTCRRRELLDLAEFAAMPGRNAVWVEAEDTGMDGQRGSLPSAG